jgi:hypothetical protein
VIEILGVEPLDLDDEAGFDAAAAFVNDDKNDELAAAAAAAGFNIASFCACE